MDTLRTLLRQSGALLVATLVVNASAFLLNLYVGRTLGPAQYGTLGALLSLFYLLVIPAAAIQTGIMRFAGDSRASANRLRLAGLLQRLIQFLLVATLVAALSIFLGARQLMSFFGLNTVWPILGLVVMLGLTMFLAVNRGALQGWQRFGPVSINISLEAVARLVFALVFVIRGYGITGVIFGYALAVLISYLATWLNLPWPKAMNDGPAIREILSFSAPVLITYIAFAWMTNIDVLIVKRFLEDQVVGYYVALATLARSLSLVSTALTEAMFSQLVDQQAGPNRRRVLYQTLGIDLAICGVAVGVAVFLAEPVMSMIFGPSFVPASAQLWRFCFASAAFTLIVVFSKNFLAQETISFVPFLIGMSILQLVLLVLFHDSIEQVLNILIISYTLTLLGMICFDSLARSRRTGLAVAAQRAEADDQRLQGHVP